MSALCQGRPYDTTSPHRCQPCLQRGAHVLAVLDGVARTYLAICVSQNSVIQNRSIYEDAHIFARAPHDMRMLSLRDHRAYPFGVFRPEMI